MAKRNSKKEDRKRRLLFLILLFVLTLGIGATATYAWFTSNQTVTVEDIDVEVSAVNGLQISSDAENWKAKVTKAELITGYTNSKNQLPSVFGQVSSAGDIGTGGKMNMFSGVVEAIPEGQTNAGQYGLKTTAITEELQCSGTTDGCANARFAVFDIFLRVDQDTEVVLDEVANVVPLAAPEPDKGIQNATRVAFVVEGHGEPGVTPATAQGYNSASEAIIWEPNMDMHTSTGAQNGQTVYGLTGTSIQTGGGASKIAYSGVKEAFNSYILLNQANATNNGTYFKNVTTIGTPGTRSGAVDLFTNTKKLLAGVTKVRVYWWVEGQDIDTENNATGSKMKLKLSFSIKNPNP